MQDFEIRDIIFNAAFDGLKSFVESGKMDAKRWEGPEAITAEFELQQCYAWFTKVRPYQEEQVDSIDKLEEFEKDDQKYFERLGRVREWLR
jgi:hypothetical protein